MAIKKYLQGIILVIIGAFTLSVAVANALPQSASAVTVATNTNQFAASECAAGSAGKQCRNLYAKYLNPLVKLLSAVVGVLVVLMVIMGGVQYSAAGSDPQKVAEAKKKITNALLGLAAYIFLFAFLNWLVPGGIV